MEENRNKDAKLEELNEQASCEAKGEERSHKCCGHDHEEGGHHCCDHDHNHYGEEGEEFDTIHLVLDDGNELDCGVIDIFDVEDDSYIALVTLDDAEEVLLYKYTELEDDSEEIQLGMIEDEEEFNRAAEVFNELYGEDE